MPQVIRDITTSGIAPFKGWETRAETGTFNVLNYGAKLNAKRMKGATNSGSSGSTTLTVPGAGFTSADVGKYIYCHTQFSGGSIRTIVAVTNSTTVTLSGGAGIALNGATSDIACWGTNDTAAFQACANDAGAASAAGRLLDGDINLPVALGHPTMVVPNVNAGGFILAGSTSLTVPSGVRWQGAGTMAYGLLTDRTIPVINFGKDERIDEVQLYACYGGGLVFGADAIHVHNVIGRVNVWVPGATQTAVTIKGYHTEIDLINFKQLISGSKAVDMTGASDIYIGEIYTIGGAAPGVTISNSNNVTLNHLRGDTVTGTTGAALLTIDAGSTNVRFAIQAFVITSGSLDNLVRIGDNSTAINKGIYGTIQAQRTGGTLLRLAYAQEVWISMQAANTDTYSFGQPITQGVVYGSGLSGPINVEAWLPTGVTPFTGTRVGEFILHDPTSWSVNNGSTGMRLNETSGKFTIGAPDQSGGKLSIGTAGTGEQGVYVDHQTTSASSLAAYQAQLGLAANRAFQSTQIGDTIARAVMDGNGTWALGSGAATREVTYGRTGAGAFGITAATTTFTGDVNITGAITAGSGLGGGGSTSTSVPWRRQTPKYWGPVNVVENFQSGHAWVHDGGFGSVALNTTSAIAHHGTQVARVITDAAASTGSISVTGKTAVDLTGNNKHVRFWVYVPSSQAMGAFQLRAAGAGGLAAGNHITWNLLSSATTSLNQPATTGTASTQYYMDASTLVPVQLSIGDAVVTGSPDLSAITEWRIIAADRGASTPGGAAAQTLNFSGIEVAPNGLAEFGNKGVCVFTFDDSMAGQATYVRQGLGKKGWQATIFPIVDRLGFSATYITLAQLKTLAYEGHEVGIHSYTLAVHNSFQTNTDVFADVQADTALAAAWTQDQGFGSTSLAYPNGTFGPSLASGQSSFGAYWKAQSKWFDTARTTSQNLQLNPTPVLNPMKIHAVTVGGSLAPTITQMVGAGGLIERAATSNSLLVFTMHDVSTSATGLTNVLNTDFDILLNAVQNSGMAVATLGQVAQTLGF